jgi:hypothetical protein
LDYPSDYVKWKIMKFDDLLTPMIDRPSMIDNPTLDRWILTIVRNLKAAAPKSLNAQEPIGQPYRETLRTIAAFRNEVLADQLGLFGLDLEIEDGKYCVECGLRAADWMDGELCYAAGQHDTTCDPLNNGWHDENVHCQDRSCALCNEHATFGIPEA